MAKNKRTPWYMNVDIKGSHHNVGTHILCKISDCKYLLKKYVRRNKMELERSINHAIQTIMSQIVDVNNNIRTQQDNKDIDEKDKVATTNFANYHLMVLCILLHDFESYARSKFPDAKPIIDWAMAHYNWGLQNKSFTPCKCEQCKADQEEAAKIAENDKKILES